MRIYFLPLLVVFLSIILLPAFGAAEEGTATAALFSGGALDISADQLSAENREDGMNIRFSGQVRASRGEAVLHADELLLVLVEEGGQVERVEATGRVRIEEPGRLATAERVVYIQPEGRVELSGAPLIRQGGNSLQGERIEIFLSDGRSVVHGGPQGRVRAHLDSAEVRP